MTPPFKIETMATPTQKHCEGLSSVRTNGMQATFETPPLLPPNQKSREKKTSFTQKQWLVGLF